MFQAHRPGTVIVWALLLAGCAVNPLTGERNFSIIPESQEVAMGKEAAAEVAQSIGLLDDARAQKYVSDLGQSLSAVSERPNLPWSFQVVDDPVVNAFALPGGPIFVTRGLLTHLGSEAQLAAVVGHEIGHVTGRHSVRMMSKATLAQLGLGVGMVFSETLRSMGQLGMAGMQLLFLKYGRDAEREADELGYRYSLEKNYDVRSMPDVFATLKRVGESSGQSRLPNWMATHPSPDERIQRINKLIAEKNPPAGKVDREQYLAVTDGMVFGPNPRNGFYEGGFFKHPEMRFQIAIPQGWKSQNLAQAVVAEAPQGNLGFQLATSKEPPAQSFEQFTSQKGITALERFDAQVAGSPAPAARFAAQTEGGAIRGVVTFFTHQGRTFGILGLSAPETFPAAEGALRQVIGSFGPLTDPAALNVQPARLKVVTVDRNTTLAEFASRYPSGLSADRVSIINQLEPGSPLRAGQKIKVVQGTVREASNAVAAR
jgi:predicted Zn-dependent protease